MTTRVFLGILPVSTTAWQILGNSTTVDVGNFIERSKLKINRNTKTIALASLIFLLNACAGGNLGRFVGGESEQRAERLASEGRYDEAAEIFIGLATDAQAAERDRLTLLAAEQWLNAGDGRRAKSALQSVATPADGELLWLWSADAAALALWEGRPDDAMQLLAPLGAQALPPAHRIRVEALRADAWFQLGQPARAVELYIQRETWLDDQRSIDNNRRRLWAGLGVSQVGDLRQAAAISTDPVTGGWLELGVLAVSTGQQGVGWSNGVVRWQEAHANHPAATILGELALPEGGPMEYPRQIALVRNGFLGAYFAATSNLEQTQNVVVYDTSAEGGALTAYERAVIEGAEFVIGPLLRRDVGEVGAIGLLPVPVLTLNYLAENVEAPSGLYQFALAPEDEARSAALQASADGATRAIALYANNDWGRRVAGSFANEFAANGGELLAHRSYQPSSQDFSVEIEGLMGLAQSVQRYQRLRANIGGPLQFDPRRRQDVDAIFLAADAKVGRLIKSQLKFHYSGDLPVYSTSFIYSMDGRSNSDLNGIMFADTPWTVAPPTWIADFPEIYEEYWPAEKRLARLHAMGYDAYHLVSAIFAARGPAIDEIVGATGRLYFGADGRVHRQLAWARFEGGQPIAIPETDPFAPDPFAPEGESMQDVPVYEDGQEWQPPSPNP
jgi:outer membrane PBP1 activator LpoA protein